MNETFDIAWELMKSDDEVVCDFCEKSVPSHHIARSSTNYPPIKPRWEGCYDCLKAGKIIDNDGGSIK